MALTSVQASSRRKISICPEVKIAFMKSKKIAARRNFPMKVVCEKTGNGLQRIRAFTVTPKSDGLRETRPVIEWFDFNFHRAGKAG
jgi:hypothetical protein